MFFFYDSGYYSSICSSKWHQFRVSAPLQTVTINGFKWKPAIWNEYRRFLEKAHKRFIINRNWISKHVFYSNLMCSFVWKHLFVCQVNIFLCFWGKMPYLIKKSQIRRFDSTISSIANLEMLLHLNFYWWFLYWGHFRTILAELPLWQPQVTLSVGKIPKRPPNDVIQFGCFYVFIKH